MHIPCSLPTDRPVRVVIHSGSFHADELLALAALSIYFRQKGLSYVYERTRDPSVIKHADVVCDVGGTLDAAHGRFDHHQREGAGARDGIPYSSFGLVWKYFGPEICSDNARVWHTIEKKIAFPVDAGDNGMSVYSSLRHGVHPLLFHNIVFAFHPTWKEKEQGVDVNERFDELLQLAERYLEREIVVARDNEEGARLVRDNYHAAEDKRIIVLDRDLPWEEELAKHIEPIFVVSPRAVEGGGSMWRIECVRSDVNTFDCRKPLPGAWRGLMNEELERASGVHGATFCHRKGFLAIAKTKEGALRLAHIALENGHH